VEGFSSKSMRSVLLLFLSAALASAARLPVAFEPNRGQAAAQVRFVTHSQAATVLFTDSGAFMRLPQGVLEIGLVGAKSRGASGCPTSGAWGI